MKENHDILQNFIHFIEVKCDEHVFILFNLRQNNVEKNMRAPPKRIFTPLCGQGPEAQRAREGRARARARARALSPPRKRECSNFNKDNPQFDQGKSCSVSRVWQLCQI